MARVAFNCSVPTIAEYLRAQKRLPACDTCVCPRAHEHFLGLVRSKSASTRSRETRSHAKRMPVIATTESYSVETVLARVTVRRLQENSAKRQAMHALD